MVGIYKITNKINGKCYIGQSKSIENRWKQHVLDLGKDEHHCFKLQEDYNKHGIINFCFEVLEITDNEDKMNSIEQWHMDDNIENLYNSKRVISKNNLATKNSLNNQIFIPKHNISFQSILTQRLFFMIIEKAIKNNERYSEVSVVEFIKNIKTKGNSIYDRFESIKEELGRIEIGSTKIFDVCEYDNYAMCCNISRDAFNMIICNYNSNIFDNIDFNKIYAIKNLKTIPILTMINNGKSHIKVNEFKDILKINEKYEQYSELKRNVLEPILKDIKNIGLNMTVLETKKRRMVYELEFTVKE